MSENSSFHRIINNPWTAQAVPSSSSNVGDIGVIRNQEHMPWIVASVHLGTKYDMAGGGRQFDEGPA